MKKKNATVNQQHNYYDNKGNAIHLPSDTCVVVPLSCLDWQTDSGLCFEDMNIILYICVYMVDDEWCMADSELVITPNMLHKFLDFEFETAIISLRDGIKDGLFPSLDFKFISNITQVMVLLLWVEQLSLCDC